LTDKTVAEEQQYLAKMAIKPELYPVNLMPSYTFMLTYNCNLRCSYCYQDHLRNNPAYKHLLKTMEPEMVDRIFAAIPQLEVSQELRKDLGLPRNIVFSGGEPLLAENYATVEYIINKALSLGKANFSAITNGTELAAYQNLLGKDKISKLQITLDGTKNEHDQRRIYPDGSGSFDKIADNISLALSLGVQLELRVNIDRNNINQLPELAKEIIDRGWNDYQSFSAVAVPITNDKLNDLDSVKTTFSYWELGHALETMRQADPNMYVINQLDDELVAKVKQIFKQGDDPLANLNANFCRTNNKMYAIDPLGDIYACEKKAGDAKIRIGYIAEDSKVMLNQELNQAWSNPTAINNSTCRQCRYAFYCGGNCAALGISNQEQIDANYCDNFESRFRTIVAQAYQDHVQQSGALVKPEKVCIS
ncbi:MAG: radical SAM protein, partial [Cyanobacteria bacterium J06558_2]